MERIIMLRKILRAWVVAAFLIVSAGFVSLLGTKSVFASACSGTFTPERTSASLGEVIYFSWSVSCPQGVDTTKFFVDSWDDAHGFLETNKLTSGHDYIPTTKFGAGSHMAFMVIYGEGEGRQNPAVYQWGFSVIGSSQPEPTVTPVPVSPAQPTAVPAQGTNNSGGMDSAKSGDGVNMAVYCQLKGLGPVYDPPDGDAYKWRCGNTTLDMNEVCKEVWGADYHAYLDPTANPPKYGWRCRQGDTSSPSATQPPPRGQNICPKDADGIQLEQRPNGDCLFRKAFGSTSPQSDWYIYVPVTSGSLYCRTTPIGGNDHSNVRATMQTDNYFNVIAVSPDWIHVESSLGSCWVGAKFVTLTDTRQSKPQGFDIQDISVLLTDGTTFVFRWNSKLHWIINGSEFVITQITKVNSRVDGKSVPEQVAAVFKYALPVIGEADKNVVAIRNQLCNHDTDCETKVAYRVGNRSMDLSGVGNIAYGYYLDSLDLPLQMSDTLANWDQLISSLRAKEFITTRDNPDDLLQRQVGRELRKRGLSQQNLNDIADKLGLY